MKRHLKNRTVYRIYTEDKNRIETLRLVSDNFTNFCFFTGMASWHGKLESTIIFEIVDDGQLVQVFKWLKILCKQIAELNQQDEILLTETKADIRFLN